MTVWNGHVAGSHIIEPETGRQMNFLSLQKTGCTLACSLQYRLQGRNPVFTDIDIFITPLEVMGSPQICIIAHSLVFPDRDFNGIVASIDTRLDPVSRAVEVRAVIPNDDGLLKPGMFMTVDLQRDRGDVLMAPEQAIVPEGSRQYVFVINAGVAEKRQVRLGRRIPGYVVVSEGLSSGESVVTEGTHKVRDGSQVESLEANIAVSGTTPDGG